MKLKHKAAIAVLVMVCSIFASCIYGFAAIPPSDSPQYTGLSSAGAGLTISTSGYASCYSFASLYPNYSATLTMSLYKDGSSIKSWSTSGSGRFSLDKGYYVASGHTYQVIAVITVRNSAGSIVDSVTARSPIKNY